MNFSKKLTTSHTLSFSDPHTNVPTHPRNSCNLEDSLLLAFYPLWTSKFVPKSCFLISHRKNFGNIFLKEEKMCYSSVNP